MTAVALAEPLTPEWFEARRAGVTASEIAAVMGISPWESPFSLYWRKVNGWEVEETDEMRAGRLLEGAIARWWEDECDPLENLAVRPAPLYAHPDRPWQLATPDRALHEACPDCDGRGAGGSNAAPWGPCCSCQWTGLGSPALAVLECKYVAHSWDGWGEPGTDHIPVHYRAQVLWQCDVVDVDTWYLAALGPGGFREYHGRRDDRDLAVMREYARRFLNRIQHGDPPPVDDHAATLSTVKKVHPLTGAGDVELVDELGTERAVQLAEGYRRARALRGRADAAVDRYEARLRQALGSHRRALCNGRLVASRSVYDQSGDSAELMAIDNGWPTVDRLNPGRAKTYAS